MGEPCTQYGGLKLHNLLTELQVKWFGITRPTATLQPQLLEFWVSLLALLALRIQDSHLCCCYLSTPSACKSGGCPSNKEHNYRRLPSMQSTHTCFTHLFCFLRPLVRERNTSHLQSLLQRKDCHLDHFRQNPLEVEPAAAKGVY